MARRPLLCVLWLEAFVACNGDESATQVPETGDSSSGSTDRDDSSSDRGGESSSGGGTTNDVDETTIAESTSTETSGSVDETSGTSSTTDVPAACGNGVVEVDEECDEGDANSNTGACKLDCTSAFCGDTFVGPDEECDDSDGVNWNACTNMCTLPTCGDFIHSTGEGCDDGDVDDNDACTSLCEPASCGDGFVWLGMETCDDGNTADDDMCPSTCLSASCGDGFVEIGVETCDDGNLDNTDACPSTCTPAACGDGFVRAGVEQCDDANDVDTDSCLTGCIAADCGDGIVEAGVESCDDGNGDDTDDCPGSCQGAMCGDGFSWAGVETCDDGNAIDTDACPGSCEPAFCGDGFVRVGVEQCDDADGSNANACTNACTNAFCGDGFVRVGVEDCDDGNGTADDGCENDCTFTPDPCGAPGNVIYVDADATGANDGTSWADAYTSVFQAMQSSGNNDELWIADGTYRGVLANAPVATLHTCVDIYGGFVGTESSIDERPSPLAATIFDGDFAADDGANGLTDNSIHVVAGSGIANVTIDGVTVTHGRALGAAADARGGGIYALNVSALALTEVVLVANRATLGAGLYAESSDLSVEASTLQANAGTTGGAAYLLTTTAAISGVELDANTATDGGAIYVSGGASAVAVAASAFANNQGVSNGGAIACTSFSTCTITGCDFTGNVVTNASGNGGAVYGSGTSTQIFDSLFLDNTADDGGACYLSGSNDVIDNATFDGNTAVRGGAVYGSGFGASLTVGNSLFTTNSASSRGGAFYMETRLTLSDSELSGNTAVTGGGAMHVGVNDSLYGNIVVTATRFIDNSATGGSGGAIGSALADFSAPWQRIYLNSTTFENNAASSQSGAVHAVGPLTVRDSRFFTNTAGSSGGAIVVGSSASTPYIRDSTFYQNIAGGVGGGLAITGAASTGTIRNTVFWGNSSDMDGAALVTITYTCSEDFLSINPSNVLAFDDPIVLGPSNELFLDQGSDCIDTGDDGTATTEYAAIGLDWSQLTTSIDSTLDASPVDPGTHYPP